MKKFVLKCMPVGLIMLCIVTSALTTKAQSKEEIIAGSYIVAFGRTPNAGEMNYWKQNVGNNNMSTMVANHKAYMKTALSEAEQVVRRSYLDAFGVSATEGEIKYWAPQARSYAELMNQHVASWLATNPGKRQEVINLSYQRVFGRSPNSDEMKYWMGVRPCSYVELVGMHTTYKNANPSQPSGNTQSTSGGLIAPGLNTANVSTVKLSTVAANAMVAAGGGNIIAAGGGNIIAAGGGNMVAAGGGNMVAAGGGN